MQRLKLAGYNTKNLIGDVQEIALSVLREIYRLILEMSRLRRDIQKQYKNVIWVSIQLLDCACVSASAYIKADYSDLSLCIDCYVNDHQDSRV